MHRCFYSILLHYFLVVSSTKAITQSDQIFESLSLSHYLNNADIFIMPSWSSVFQDDTLGLPKVLRYIAISKAGGGYSAATEISLPLGWWERLWETIASAKIPSRRLGLQVTCWLWVCIFNERELHWSAYASPPASSTSVLVLLSFNRWKCDLHCVHVIYVTSLLINARDKEVPSLQSAHDVLQHCLLWHFLMPPQRGFIMTDCFLCIILKSNKSHTCPYPCQTLLCCLHIKS